MPTHNHGRLLRHSTATALAQTVQEIELLIVGDGADDETRRVAESVAREDPRVTFVDHPKGARHGESHRHAVLSTRARGRIVCYLSDDDLLFPDHVETMERLLETCDLAGGSPITVKTDGSLIVHHEVDIANPFHRRMMLDGISFMGLTAMAHTLDYYKGLPHGWRVTPPGIPTDLYMCQQFLADPACRAQRAVRPTLLYFPSVARQGRTLEEREAEMLPWLHTLAAAPDRAALYERLLSVSLETGYADWRHIRDLIHAVENAPPSKPEPLARWSSTSLVGRTLRWMARRAGAL